MFSFILEHFIVAPATRSGSSQKVVVPSYIIIVFGPLLFLFISSKPSWNAPTMLAFLSDLAGWVDGGLRRTEASAAAERLQIIIIIIKYNHLIATSVLK